MGNNAIIQTNALKSWKLLRPECEIIVFGNSLGTDKICHDLDLIHIPEIQCNKFGTPLLNDLFEKSQKLSKFGLLCYINADIILLSDFIEALKIVLKTEDNFLMVGQRQDYDITESLDFGLNWEKNLKNSVIKTGKMHSRTGIDYFAFNAGLFKDIPPFAIGRTAWDNWLLYGALASGAKLIDASNSIMCIHQNHDWSHIKGGKNEAWEGKEAINNRKLATGKILTLDDSTFTLTLDGLKSNNRKRILNKLRGLKTLLIEKTLPSI